MKIMDKGSHLYLRPGSEESRELQELLIQCVYDGLCPADKLIALDLGELGRIDASTVGTLLWAARKAAHAGGGIALLGPARSVRESLTVIKLHTRLNIFESEAEALFDFMETRARRPPRRELAPCG